MELQNCEISDHPASPLLRPTRRGFLRGAGIIGLAAALPQTLRPLEARAASTGTAAVKSVSNANRVLLERGLCLGAWVTTAATGRYVPTSAEWEAVGFNTVVWYEAPYFDARLFDSLPDSTQWGVATYPNNSGGPHLPGPPAPGTQVLGDSDQRANVDRLFSVCIGDEEAYTDQVVSWVQQWIALGRDQLGTDHLFQNNQYLGEWGQAQLQTYLAQAEPDVITYDTYPFGSPSPYPQGNRPDILDGINSYRQLAQGGVDGSGREPIAFGLYTEGYKGGSGYTYVPSESEIMFNHHSIWTMGGKWAVMFRWEKGASTFLFYRADGSHTPQFSQFGTALHQSQLLSPYLVRLQNRDIRVDLGQHKDTTGSATPNAQPATVQLWDSYASPYVSSITVKNTGGGNGGLRGDAVLSTFVPLPIPSGTTPQPLAAADAAILSEPNTKYLMVLNGLIAPNSNGGFDAVDGFAADCRQRFTLDLPRIADRPSQVRAVDLKTGHLVTLPSTARGASGDTVHLELDGGTSTLICVRTGGPTVDQGPNLDLAAAQPVTGANGQVDVAVTLTNTTTTAFTGLVAQLELPDGWTSSPAGSVTVGKLGSGASTKVAWTVQAPSSATPGAYTLKALVTWPYAARTTALGGGRASTVVAIPYATGPTTSFQPSAVQLSGGNSAQTTISFTNPTGSSATTVNWEIYAPAGNVTASPATGTTTVPAGGSVDVPVSIGVASGAKPGVLSLTVRPAAGSAPFVPRSLPVQTGAGSGTVEAVVATFSTPSATVIGTAAGSVVATIPVGNNPGSVIISGDASTAWVANQSSHSVTRIDLTTNSVTATIDVGNVPAGLALTPDGQTLWVTNYSDGTVQPIDVATNQAGATIRVGNHPENLVITPDGRWLYVANQGSATVTPIDLTTTTARSEIPVQSAPFAIVASPDGGTVYVGSSGSTIVPIRTADNQALSPIAVSGQAYGLRAAPDGSTLWVTDSGSDTATPVDTATGLSGKAVTVGNAASDIALTWDGATAFVACASDNTVVPFDTGTGKVGTPITTTGSYPLAIAITPLPVS